jgi:NitT/TauT family transport system ATP-binding protein
MPNSPQAHRPSKSLSEMHPIARVSVGQVLGLVEAIDEVGGTADVATISQEVEMDIDRLGPVIDAGELLGFVKVEEGDLTITDLSRNVLHANVRERKKIIREIIDDVPIFKQVLEMAKSAGRPLSREEVLGTIAARVGTHNADDLFNALVYWGRYTELVNYDSESEQLTIRAPSE